MDAAWFVVPTESGGGGNCEKEGKGKGKQEIGGRTVVCDGDHFAFAGAR